VCGKKIKKKNKQNIKTMPAKKSTKPNKKSAPKNQKKEKVEPVSVEPPVVETPVIQGAPPVAVDDINYQNEFSDVQDKLKVALGLIKELSFQVSRLEKRVTRDQKVMSKKMKGKTKRVVDPNKPPSGFAKPGKISDELRSFLSLGKDDLIARTEVTKRITKYCQENKLQKPEDRRTIHVDPPLRKLLRIPKGETLTFFNLQKYMKIHYPNKEGVFIHQ
jgi:chromatin remodeling complex protein RSC6